MQSQNNAKKRITSSARTIFAVCVFLTLCWLGYKIANALYCHSWLEVAPVHIKNISNAVEIFKKEAGAYPNSLTQMSTNSHFEFREFVAEIIDQTNNFIFEYHLENGGYSITARSSLGHWGQEQVITEHFSETVTNK